MAEMVANQGRRGFSVAPADRAPAEPGAAATRLVFRSFDEGAEDRVRIEADVPVSVEGRVGLRFCPWCGRRLPGSG